MNLLDLLAALLLVAAVIAGIRTGALPQVGGILGAIGGLALALAAGPWLVDVTGGLEPLPRALVVLGALLGLVVAGQGLGSAIGRIAAGGLGRGVLSALDRTAGGLLGAVQAVLVVWLAGGLLAAGPIPALGRIASQSTVVRTLATVLPPPEELVGDVVGALDASGLPDVFVGLEPIAEPVDRPTDPRARAIAAAALASTPRVSTRACTEFITGSAAVVARHYLVTNAHVVAGSKVVRVGLDEHVVDATVVVFDPQLDVALLYAPAFEAPALRFATAEPGRGTVGAAIGYPNGGGQTVLAAAVSATYAATGRDIYGRTRVTRDVLELRAAVEPGDSGGPFVLEDGTIGGLVFAESRTDPDVGYALSPTDVAVRIQPGIGRTGAVETGDCIR